jgi:ATP-binding cassette subfamily F protein 3
VALAGPNGCGKSTLLKIAAGLMAPDGGDVDVGEGVVSRLLAQHVVETLTPGRTVLEELQEMAPRRGQGELRSLLGIFQFSGDDVFKKVEILSGGEKNRLALARLALDPGNFLLLDEPTNHLDFTAREALERALAEWDGAVLFVSHDRYFINRVARRMAGFAAGRLVIVEGGYDDWVSAAPHAGVEPGTPGGATSRAIQRETKREERRAVAEARNIRNQRLRALRKKVTELEASIGTRESRLSEIAAALADPDTYRHEGLAESLGKEKKALEEELAALIPQWERSSSDLHIAECAE